MKKITFLCIHTLFSLTTIAQTLSPEAALLFKNVKTKLTIAEKNLIAGKSGGELSKDKKSFTVEGESLGIDIYPVDINNDKTEEVFVIKSSSFLYGNTGQGFSFMVKDKTGKYKSVFDQMGIPQVILNSGKQLPDILVGGPGFNPPVYGWDGAKYDIVKNYNTTNKTFKDVEELSAEYTSTIK